MEFEQHDMGNTLLFQTEHMSERVLGEVVGEIEYPSPYGDRIYQLRLEDGRTRFAFPDEVS